MPISLTRIEAETREVEVPYGGETLGVTYAPARFSLDLIAALAAGDQIEQLRGVLVRLLVGWELLGEDGAPLPVTPELVGRLPITLVNAVSSAVLGDYQATVGTDLAVSPPAAGVGVTRLRRPRRRAG